MSRKTSLIVACAAVLAMGLFVTARAQNGAAQPTKVAVVSLQEVIAQCNQQQKFRTENQARGADLQAEQEQRQNKIQGLRTQIDPLQTGTDAWRAKRDEIQQATMELEVWAKMQEQNTQLEQARQFAEIYQSANDAAGEVAQSMGFDIVLQAGDLPDLMSLNVQQLQSIVQSRKVLYAGDNVDITQAVLQRVNANFDQR